LDDIAGFRTVHILSTLSRQGLIKMEDGQFGIRPEALKSTMEFLKKIRLVW
jgi:chromosome segregation and condensation protein ScpB